MARSLAALRKEHGAVCPKCKSPDYKLLGGNRVKCGSCGNEWYAFPDGGNYVKCETQETALVYHKKAR